MAAKVSKRVRTAAGAPLELGADEARRFAVQASGLGVPHADVRSALRHHGFVQIDPINVCGRMHELILRTRVAGYAEGDLHRYVHGVAEDAEVGATVQAAEQREALEHFHPKRNVLATFESEAWPFLRRAMAQRARTPGRWMGQLTAEERRVARRVLAEIRERGALSSSDIEGSERSDNGWNTSRLVKVVMDKLFAHGRLLIARRGGGGRRVYDLPERLLPRELLAQRLRSRRDVERWTALLKVRQHRLTCLTKSELALISERVQHVRVADCPALYCLRADVALAESIRRGQSSGPTSNGDERLLAPLDPLILDRTVTQSLWAFDYVWEVYTPPKKRTRGYYALPILAGERFVGHVDLKRDRAARRLRVVSRSCARGFRSAPAVAQLASFLGLR